MIHIILEWDESSHYSDTFAAALAKAHIKTLELCYKNAFEDCIKFSNITYLNEWRIAIKEGLKIKLTAKYPSGYTQEFDRNGRSDVWPEEVSVFDRQLDRLL